MRYINYHCQLQCIKAYEAGFLFLHAVGGIPCRPHPAATQLVVICCVLAMAIEVHSTYMYSPEPEPLLLSSVPLNEEI